LIVFTAAIYKSVSFWGDVTATPQTSPPLVYVTYNTITQQNTITTTHNDTPLKTGKSGYCQK